MTGLAALSGLSPAGALARTSANYTVAPESIDAGGARTTSAAYTIDGSVGSPGGIGNATSPATVARHGYPGQLFDVVGFVVDATPATINEGGTRQLRAAHLLDDATTITLNPTQVGWSVVNGPVSSISAGGLATAANVYQNTGATVQGVYQSGSDTFPLNVLNIGLDDFGLYAGDGLEDSWQVQYFGVNNPQAAPGQDPDGDGQDNNFEFVAGVVPTDGNSHFRLRIESVTGQPAHMKLIFNPVFATRTYTPLFRLHLVAGAWAPLTNTTQSDNSGERTVTDLDATAVRKFYKIEISAP